MQKQKQQLLEKFNNTKTSTLVSKESEKNSQEEEAQTRLNVSQLNSKTKISTLAVIWLIWAFSLVSIVIFGLFCWYMIDVAQQPDKLESFLSACYRELVGFIEKYQAVFAALAGFMFGDKLKRKQD